MSAVGADVSFSAAREVRALERALELIQAHGQGPGDAAYLAASERVFDEIARQDLETAAVEAVDLVNALVRFASAVSRRHAIPRDELLCLTYAALARSTIGHEPND